MRIIYQILSELVRLVRDLLRINHISRETQKALLFITIAWIYAGLFVLELAFVLLVILNAARM